MLDLEALACRDSGLRLDGLLSREKGSSWLKDLVEGLHGLRVQVL